MSVANPYQSIVEVCRESRDIQARQQRAVQAGQFYNAVYVPCEKLWKAHFEKFPEIKEFRQADFSGLFFVSPKFQEFIFTGSDFSRSEWTLAFIQKCDCSETNFSDAVAMMTPFSNTNLAGSNFCRAKLNLFPLFTANNFAGADFSNAELSIEASFLVDKTNSPRTRFDGANMQGCRIVVIKQPNAPDINQDQARAILESFFTPEQLAEITFDIRLPQPFSLKDSLGRLFKKK